MPSPAVEAGFEDDVAGIIGDFDNDNDDDVVDISSQGDYDGEHDAPGGEGDG